VPIEHVRERGIGGRGFHFLHFTQRASAAKGATGSPFASRAKGVGKKMARELFPSPFFTSGCLSLTFRTR
jgi:hypothetical protein